MKATKTTIVNQTIAAGIIVLANLIVSGWIFSYLENWTIGEGFYFSYVSFMTIGYGDYVLKTFLGRSIFIWYVFIAVASSTYTFSMLSELAYNQWTVTTDSIAKRVDRYETKARWKKEYLDELKRKGNKNQYHDDDEGKGKGKLKNDDLPLHKTERTGFNEPRAFSVSISHSLDQSLSSLFRDHDPEVEPLLTNIKDSPGVE